VGRLNIVGRAQNRIDEIPVAIDRAIQVASSALDLEVGLVGLPVLARAASTTVASHAQRLALTGSSLASHRRMHLWLMVIPAQ
jgi:hypothetical protein